MNLKTVKAKYLITLVFMTIFLLVGLLTNEVNAATRTYGLEEYRQADSNGNQHGYMRSDKMVWKIVTINGSAIDYSRTLYCLKAEQGFYTATPGVMQETYDETYNFKDKASMNPLPVPEQYYNSIVWILNHSYIPSASTAQEDKATLLADAGITGNNGLTDDDIDVVQQLAIWYYTNYDDPIYHSNQSGIGPSMQSVWESVKDSSGSESEYQSINDKNMYRYDDMEKLFRYFIENADKAGDEVVQDVVPVTFTANGLNATIEGDSYIAGPYLFTENTTNPYNVSFSVTSQSGADLNGKYKVLNSSKKETNNTIADMMGQTFYLKIPLSTVTSENITSVKVGMNGSYTVTNATYWTKQGNNSVQPIVEVTREPKTFNDEKEVPLPQLGNYVLKLIKVDQNNPSTKLAGAEFKITSPNGEETLTTNSNGEITLSAIQVSGAGTDTITIEETKAPDGYEKIITAPIVVQVTKALSGNTYGMQNATITNQQSGASINVAGNVITVTVENKLIPKDSEYNLKLVKVEQGNTSNKLEGAEFKINSPKGEVTQTTNANGEINIGPIAVTSEGTDTITIEETKAPDGYDKIITDPITVQVTKTFTNNTYTMSDAKITNAQTGSSISLSGNTITVTVENKLIPKNSDYNLRLIKVEEGTSNRLQGAEFKITSPNGEVTQTTTANGEINIGTIAVTAEGTDTITIEETKAPAGYEKIITDPIQVEVTKVFENNTYSMSDAKIVNEQTGASISLSGNTITVTVENRGKYFDLALRKYITQVNGENVENTRVPNIDYDSYI